MALPNRIDPFGRFLTVDARGSMMGNRGGRLHLPDRRLGARRFVSKRWICCQLRFKGRRRKVWSQGYSELFFLDEVVALAAGHRPCAECRRAAFQAYKAASGFKWAEEVDQRLHEERLAPQVARLVDFDELPDGAMFAAGGDALTKLKGQILRYRPAGWEMASPGSNFVRLLTPGLSLWVLKSGYLPLWHESVAEERSC